MKHTWKPPKDLDAECLELCRAMNSIPRLETTESCCGHGKSSYTIFFETRSMKALAVVCYAADPCHSGACGWRVIAHTDCGMRPAAFYLEGPQGDYSGADAIAKVIEVSL
jgi:hypothetical protein